jgi:hypothetical protein
VQVAITIVLFLSWVLLFYLPNYTNQLHYMDPDDITGSTLTQMKILYGVANALYVIAWFVGNSYNNAALTDHMDLEPAEDEDYDGLDMDDDE